MSGRDGIETLEEYIKIIKEIKEKLPTKILFFRGHTKEIDDIKPSLLREKIYQEKEHILYQELLISHPEEFKYEHSTLDKLVKMQHYGLPTRLLDITSDPLIALYFACQPDNDSKVDTGEVVIFKTDREQQKYPDSDTACLIANLVRLNKNEKEDIISAINYCTKNRHETQEINNYKKCYIKFLHYIKHDKPFFKERINSRDLNKIILLNPYKNNPRIIAQSGAFLLFGLNESLLTNDMIIKRIKVTNKKNIYKELKLLNINHQTVFPDLEHSAKHIKEEYSYIP